MSTNYYIITNHCDCCGREDAIHIGRSSYGWKFQFQATPTVRNTQQWVAQLKSAWKITSDGTSKALTVEEILDVIESSKDGLSPADYPDIPDVYVDASGNCFFEREFS